MTIIVRSLEGYSADVWANLPWRLFERRLVRLQRRIHKASKTKNRDLVKNLQRLLIGSNSARYLSVRYALDANVLDKKSDDTKYTYLNSTQKIQLVNELKYPRILKYQLSDHLSNKKNVEDDLAHLKILSLQSLLKYAIEPVVGLPSLQYFYKGQFIDSFYYLKCRHKTAWTKPLGSLLGGFINDHTFRFNFHKLPLGLYLPITINRFLIYKSHFMELYGIQGFQRK